MCARHRAKHLAHTSVNSHCFIPILQRDKLRPKRSGNLHKVNSISKLGFNTRQSSLCTSLHVGPSSGRRWERSEQAGAILDGGGPGVGAGTPTLTVDVWDIRNSAFALYFNTHGEVHEEMWDATRTPSLQELLPKTFWSWLLLFHCCSQMLYPFRGSLWFELKENIFLPCPPSLSTVKKKERPWRTCSSVVSFGPMVQRS